MTRIFHLIPTLSGGGAERQLALLAKEQARRGWDVHVGIRRSGVYASMLLSNGVSIHMVGDHKGLNPKLVIGINKLIKKIAPDLIQTWLPQMDIIGGIIALHRSKPWVISERSSKKAYEGFSFQILVRSYLARYAAAIVGNSMRGVSYWRDLLPSSTRIFHISNAVNVAEVCNAPPVFPCSLASNICNQFVLVVGRLLPTKGQDVVIKAIGAVSLSQPVGALIIGDGPLQQELENMIRKLDVGDRVFLSPFRPDWWGLLNSAIALVTMSHFEGHPNVLLEAIAGGCPVIVSDIPEHRAILSEDFAIFVPIDDHLALATAISSVVANQAAAQKRAESARDYVTSMTIESAASKYEVVYEKVLFGVNK